MINMNMFYDSKNKKKLLKKSLKLKYYFRLNLMHQNKNRNIEEL